MCCFTPPQILRTLDTFPSDQGKFRVSLLPCTLSPPPPCTLCFHHYAAIYPHHHTLCPHHCIAPSAATAILPSTTTATLPLLLLPLPLPPPALHPLCASPSAPQPLLSAPLAISPTKPSRPLGPLLHSLSHRLAALDPPTSSLHTLYRPLTLPSLPHSPTCRLAAAASLLSLACAVSAVLDPRPQTPHLPLPHCLTASDHLLSYLSLVRTVSAT